MTTALVLPSPFLAADAHAPLADALGRRGWGVVVSTPPPTPGAAGEVLERFRADAARVAPDVVVAHSNAGRFAAWVAPAGAAVVYVDAALPPSAGEAPLAPPALVDVLAERVGADGVLPPWTRWWDEADLGAVVPDPGVLASLRQHEPRVPLSYVRSVLGGAPGWQEVPSAYLAFGSTYGEEVATARRLGWPVRVLDDALHLHLLLEPDVVAEEVEALLARVREARQ